MKKSRAHQKRRTSGSEGRRDHNASSRKSSKSSGAPHPLQRNASSTSSRHSHRSQLVDLVVEDHEAEEEDREQAQRELGSAWAGDETRHFS